MSTALSNDAILEAIGGKTVVELSELIEAFTTKFNVSIVAAAEYVAQTRMLAEAEGDRRTELLSILVSGYDESDARVVRLLKRAGYFEQRLNFCVALAQSTDPLEMENPSKAFKSNPQVPVELELT